MVTAKSGQMNSHERHDVHLSGSRRIGAADAGTSMEAAGHTHAQSPQFLHRTESKRGVDRTRSFDGVDLKISPPSARWSCPRSRETKGIAFQSCAVCPSSRGASMALELESHMQDGFDPKRTETFRLLRYPSHRYRFPIPNVGLALRPLLEYSVILRPGAERAARPIEAASTSRSEPSCAPGMILPHVRRNAP